ncbi:MAG: hypothetical protein R3F49_00180 [Planctomycetota bacterium]
MRHKSQLRHGLRRPAALLASSLALAALLAAPAAAQRRTEWQIGVGHQTERAHIGVSVGSRGVQVNAGYRERGRQPVVRHRPEPAGRWETRCERVWVPGAIRKVWVPPIYATRYDHCGRPYQVEVRCGFWDTIQEQGCWESRETRVWVPYQRRGVSAY